MTCVEVNLRNGAILTIEKGTGVSLMEAIRERGVDDLLALCGGCCSCATCHVYVAEDDLGRLPPITEGENDLLENSSHRRENSRLACQIALSEALGDLKVTIAPED